MKETSMTRTAPTMMIRIFALFFALETYDEFFPKK